MGNLINNLRTFNSKERFFLLSYVLGAPDFIPSLTFREKISSVLGFSIPGNVFSALDYHLDWIYASLSISFSGGQTGVHPNKKRIIKGQQEDIDYIIAFEENGTFRIILIEAKATSGWNNSQLESKVKRLSDIFGIDRQYWLNVFPYFILMSPKAPINIDVSKWPHWMRRDGKAIWMKLPVPANLQKVSRCDENGRLTQSGDYWRAIGR